MSTKESEGKAIEEADGSDGDDEPEYTLLYKANNFLGKQIDGMTSSFINAHWHEFDVDEDEHKLIFTELHSDYVEMFETCWRVSSPKNAQTCPASKPSEHFLARRRLVLLVSFSPSSRRKKTSIGPLSSKY